MKEIKAIIQPFMLEPVLHALESLPDLPGVTVSQVLGWGRSHSVHVQAPVLEGGHAFAPKAKLEIVVSDEAAPDVLRVIVDSARTGRAGDGKVFVYVVGEVVRIRTGESGRSAL